ncbi:MAG: methylamine utilization protein [Nitriliruptorales bacterium]|nr:methylamine utilization protein [Nitriliruptorales bacterium]
MVGTLTGPTAVVHGGTSLWQQTGFHLLGLLTGALPTGAALGALGALLGVARLGPARAALWALLTAAYGLHELALVRMPHPQRSRQVPHHWRRRYAPRRVAFAYGLLLGPGFLVFVRSTAYYLAVLGVVLSGSPGLGALVFGLIALGRSAPLVASTVFQQGGGVLPQFLEGTVRADPWARLVSGWVLLALAGAALAAVL